MTGKKYKWSIDYLAVGPMSKAAPAASGVRDESGAELKSCTGHSSKKWIKFSTAEMYQDIDISHCGLHVAAGVHQHDGDIGALADAGHHVDL